MKNGERYEDVLNLFGCVEVAYTSHEARGLNIIIRLLKALPGLCWPQLVQSPDNNHFIKYEIDAMEENHESSGKFLAG